MRLVKEQLVKEQFYLLLHIIMIKSLKSAYLFSLAVKIEDLPAELARAVLRSSSWHASAPDHPSSEEPGSGNDRKIKIQHIKIQNQQA